MHVHDPLQRLFSRTGVGAWGLTGAGGILVVSLVAMAGYAGLPEGPYSLLSYFVSELGHMVGMGVRLQSKLGWLGALLGVISSIGCMFVGIFPMDHLAPHFVAAMTFFYGGMATVVVFILALLVQPARDAGTGALDHATLPKWLAAPALPVVAFFVVFNFGLGDVGDDIGTNVLAAPETRPALWIVPFMEWLVVLGVLAWILLASTWLVLRRRRALPRATGGVTGMREKEKFSS